LGAGACQEIPLAELAARFDKITLNDVDEQPLRQAVEALALEADVRAKIHIEVADLSGVTQTALASIDRLLATAADPRVLSQLHFDLAHQAAAKLESRFPGAAVDLRRSSAWTAALYRTARQMEERFVDALANVVTDRGLVYLSESVQMCYIELADDGGWQTEGTYRMLRTTDLADYVRGRFAIRARGRWEWIVSPPAAAGETGRMYDMQALVLRRVAEQVESFG
jgi:hypothetical protein